MDNLTLPGIPKRRGRPPTGKAKSPAERMREYRERQKAVDILRLQLALEYVYEVGFRAGLSGSPCNSGDSWDVFQRHMKRMKSADKKSEAM